MTADIKALYTAYNAFNALPAENKQAADVAASTRARNVADAKQARNAEQQRHAASTSSATAKFQSSVQAIEARTAKTGGVLDEQLDHLTSSASAKGVVPSGGVAASGRAPSFSAVEALDVRLGEYIESKRGTEASLLQLRALLERELTHGTAVKRDRVTWFILVAGLLLALIIGANALAPIVLITAATIMQFRLGRGPSASMNRRIEKRPVLASDARARSGVTRRLGGLYILVGLTATAVLSSILVDVFPYWSRLHLWRWLPDNSHFSQGDEPLNALYMMLLFWPPYLYGIILLLNGLVRSAGSKIRIPKQQFVNGYPVDPVSGTAGQSNWAPPPPPGEVDDRGNPLQWRTVLKHEWVDESLRDPERLFPAEVRKRVHERAGRRCEAIYYDPFRTQWKRCTSRSQESDHVYPHATGGRSTLANAQALCQMCNVQKGALVPTVAYVQALQEARKAYFPAGESPVVRKG